MSRGTTDAVAMLDSGLVRQQPWAIREEVRCAGPYANAVRAAATHAADRHML